MINDRLTAKQVAEILGFTITNLKHYASLLELNGLEIYRNSRNHREYTEQDVKILRAMQLLNREKSISLDDAASFVMSSDTDVDAILSPVSEDIDANASDFIRVVPQESEETTDVSTHIVANMAQQLADYTALREELAARDKLMVELQSSVSMQLQEQAEASKQQTATIEGLREEVEALRKQIEDKPAPSSLWVRLFGGKK